MKSKTLIALLLVTVSIFCFCSCGDKTPAQESEVAEQTTEAIEATDEKPFAELQAAYSDGTKKWEYDANNMDMALSEALTDLSTAFTSFADYITENTTAIEAGKKLCELDGYKEAAEPIYDWAYKFSFLDIATVPADYSEKCNTLKLAASGIVINMDTAYSQEPAAATDTISEMSESVLSCINYLSALYQ